MENAKIRFATRMKEITDETRNFHNDEWILELLFGQKM